MFFESVIEIKILEPVKIRDFETGLFVSALQRGKVEGFVVLKESGDPWILIRSDGGLRGLPREGWLLHWKEVRIEVRTGRGENWKEYFNDDDLK